MTRPDTDYCIGTFIRVESSKTAKDTPYVVVIEEIGEVDEVTGKPWMIRRRFFSREISMDGKPLSELDFMALRGRRVQIRFLPGIKHEIWVLNEERGW